MATLKKRYAVVGVSQRAIFMFMDTILNEYTGNAELVAMLDKDAGRMSGFNASRKVNIPMFMPHQFDIMVEKTHPDVVIVACRDNIHHHYIVESLKYDLDVICEKPLTTDVEKCAAITRAVAASKGNVIVTFNYRYAPHVTKIKQLVAAGKVGKVVSVDLNSHLDTRHGGSYFRRWNRMREMSGGLSVHKACHHFDIVQWWLEQKPTEVFAYGALNFFGPYGAHNPLQPEQIGDGRTCPSCDVRNKCKYYMRWYREEFRTGGRKDSKSKDADFFKVYEGYDSQQCMFDPMINIEDTYAAVIKYDGGAYVNYSFNASTPYEGFHLAINGSEGRIEYDEIHAPMRLPFPQAKGEVPVVYIPMFGGREQIDIINLGGSHGGGDPLLCDELFIGTDPLAPVRYQAGLEDGIDAVLTGVALYKSAQLAKPVSLEPMRRKVFDNCDQNQQNARE
ncbi:MAG: Gfo/Idh/MocA family oxidoreductase [Planctomycetota bacterium]